MRRVRAVLRWYRHDRRASKTAMARALGVNRKTVYRWLVGIDRPSPAMQKAIEAWLSTIRNGT